MSDNREIKRIYSTTEGKMIEIPQEHRTTVGAYKNFKRPAFFAPPIKRQRGDISERKKAKG